MDSIKPATIMLIGGGVLLFIASFLDWRSFGPFGYNGWETSFWGLQGILVAAIGLIVAAGVALATFGSASLPDSLLGISRGQIYLMLSFSAFLIMFGQIGASDLAIGAFLGMIGAALMTVGAYMEEQGSGSGAAPTQF